MNQIKIGRFIAERRRAAGFTEAQLAEKLGITRHLKCPKCQKRTWCKKVLK